MSAKLYLNKTNKNGGKKNEIVLIIDIGSSSIGAAIVKNFAGKGRAPLILKNYRSSTQFTDEVETKEFIIKSKINLKHVLDSLFNVDNYFGKVDKVRVFYGPPWYHSLIKNFEKIETETKYYNEKYLECLLDTYRETDKDSQIITLEKRVTLLKLNGYRTSNPKGRSFKKIGASLYQTLVSKKTHEEIMQIIDNYTSLNDVDFISHPYSVYRVLADKFNGKNNYTIIDIGGEVTEISIVRDGDIEKIISIPKGTQCFLRELSKKMNLDFLLALSEIEQLFDPINNNNQDANKKYLDVIKKVESLWLGLIKETLNDSEIVSLPVDVFLIVDKNYQNLFINILNEIDAYYNSFRFGRKPVINLIDSDSINNLVRYRESVRKDPFLAMEAGFIEATE